MEKRISSLTARSISKRGGSAARISEEIITMNPMTEIDWNEVWIDQMKRSRETNTTRNCANIWESRKSALKFWNMSKENSHRIEGTIAGTVITPESRVLDIGSGPGTLAIPFAKKVACVTVVEPAEGMLTVLKEKMAEGGRRKHQSRPEALGGCDCGRRPRPALRRGDRILLSWDTRHPGGDRKDDRGC